MTRESIHTLEDLCTYVNEREDWPLDVEEIIQEHGWESRTGETFGLTADAENVAMFNDDVVAFVKPRRGGKREGAGRKAIGDRKLVTLAVRVAPATKEKLTRLQEEGVKIGRLIDDLAAKL